VKKDLINEEIMESRRIITAGHGGGAHERLYNKIDFRWKYCLNGIFFPVFSRQVTKSK
jgi:hypothetical protein